MGELFLIIVLLPGRLCPFRRAYGDPPRRVQIAVWLLGLVATVALAVLGAIAGSEYNLFSQLNLPRIPIDEGSLAGGAAVALVLVLIATALAAVAGGRVGERYHRKVDRAGFEPRRGEARE